MDKLLIAIDGNSLLFRAFFALSSNMNSATGTPTGALHGFFMMLSSLLNRKPDYLTVAFDVHQPTFRHLKYAEYKAGRPETPVDLIQQFEILKSLLKKMHISVIECPGFEADDILGTVSYLAGKEGVKSLIVTGDRDALQLVSDKTKVLLTKKGITETVEYDPSVLYDQFGLEPDRMKDLKALMGDNSDNIPGIPGVGEKTALKLLAEYHSLDAVLCAGDSIKGKLGEKVRENADLARLSYWLGTISKEAPIDFDLDKYAFEPDFMKNAFPDLRELDLKQSISKLSGFISEKNVQEPDSAPSYDLVDIKDSDSLKKVLDQYTKDDFTLSVCLDGVCTFAFNKNISFVLSQGETLFDSGLTIEDFFTELSSRAQNLKRFICFNVKNLYSFLEVGFFSKDMEIDDLMIEYYLNNALRPVQNVKDLFAFCYGENTAPSAALMYDIRETLMKQMAASGLCSLYSDIELPLSKILYQMENNGVLVDSDALENLGNAFSGESKKLENEIYDLAGEQFNILSPKQLGAILFEKMQLPSRKKTKSGYSTDADTLEKLIPYSPIIQPILDYRTLTKLKSTYTDGLRALISSKDGRVHTSFNQCQTATGRLSSSEPNLQNIPVRTDIGRELRKAFIAKPGYVLVDADYSQIELRLLSHISKDERLIEAFCSGEDVHRRTASEVFNTPYDEVTSSQRSAAKAVNFGIIYGISQYGLSENLKIPVATAKQYIAQYLSRYPKVDAYMKESVELAKEKGYAETLFGRKRAMPELNNSNFNVRSFGERVAMNMPIQGTAADIIKLAMLKVDKALKEQALDAQIILQVHDELIIECMEEQADLVKETLQHAMEHVADFLVPLTVEVGVGKNWYEAK